MCTLARTPSALGFEPSTAIVTTEISPRISSLLAPAVATGGASPAPAAHTRLFSHMLSAEHALQSIVRVAGHAGTVLLEGSIGGFSYEVEFKASITGTQVTVSLHVRKPIALGPYVWTFDLGGAQHNAAGDLVGASTIVAAPTLQAVPIDWWCVLRCAGNSVYKVLLKCLPSLLAGPQSYISCVVDNLSASAAEVAKCIMTECR